MVKIIYIFLITIINKSLIISFIFSRLENLAVEIENYKLDYLQNNWGNENPISINQAHF